jgi:hypothetical protein
MSEINKINDEIIEDVSGGTAQGEVWTDHGMVMYRVAYGDTLSEIALRFQTTCEAIKALNPDLIKDINKIRVDWVIRVL